LKRYGAAVGQLILSADARIGISELFAQLGGAPAGWNMQLF